MDPIGNVGNALVDEGKPIELFNFKYQQHNKFDIDGVEYNWSQIDTQVILWKILDSWGRI